MVVKCVVVGDSAVGKTRLICSRAVGTQYSLLQLSTSRVPSVWAIDQYRKSNQVREKSWNSVDDVDTVLQLWDTFGYHDKDRRFAYGSADVVIICFSVVRPNSLRSVLSHWMPEVIRICGPNVPIIVVGTQIDLRYIHREPEFMNINKGPFFKEIKDCDILPPEAGQKIAEKIGAHYYETSVLVPFGIDCTFKNAIRSALIGRRERTVWNLLGTTAGPLKKVRRPVSQRPFLSPRPSAPPINIVDIEQPWTLGAWLAAERGEHCDVIFILSNGVRVSAHRAMLICTCARFKLMFVKRESLPLFTLRDDSASAPCADKLSSPIDTVPNRSFQVHHTGLGENSKFNITIGPILPSSNSEEFLAPSHIDLPPMEGNEFAASIDYVHIDKSISSAAFSAFLRFLYTDEYSSSSDIDHQVELLSSSLGFYDFADKISDWNTKSEQIVKDARCFSRLNNINKLLLDQNLFADITFELDDGRIFGHKFMFTANCSMIRRMFTPFQFKESTMKSVKFPGISYETFKIFKRYMYVSQLTPWGLDIAEPLPIVDPVELLSFADELCLPNLLTLTESVVAEQMLRSTDDDFIKEAVLLYEPFKVMASSSLRGRGRYLKAIDVYDKSKIEKTFVQPYDHHRVRQYNKNGCLSFCNLPGKKARLEGSTSRST